MRLPTLIGLGLLVCLAGCHPPADSPSSPSSAQAGSGGGSGAPTEDGPGLADFGALWWIAKPVVTGAPCPECASQQ